MARVTVWSVELVIITEEITDVRRWSLVTLPQVSSYSYCTMAALFISEPAANCVLGRCISLEYKHSNVNLDPLPPHPPLLTPVTETRNTWWPAGDGRLGSQVYPGWILNTNCMKMYIRGRQFRVVELSGAG